MTLIRNTPQIVEIPESELSAWRGVPTAIISDELNRFHVMDAGMRLIGPGRSSAAGPALTVRTMESDNLAIHHAVAGATEGVVLVIDVGGSGRNAVWGGILHRAAELRGIRAVIVDGYVRDSDELKASRVPCYARGVVPGGPQKAWGGEIDGTISAGGCVVSSGDLVVADNDGIVVVPRSMRAAILAGAERRIEAEKSILERLNAGETTVEIFGLGA